MNLQESSDNNSLSSVSITDVEAQIGTIRGQSIRREYIRQQMVDLRLSVFTPFNISNAVLPYGRHTK
jgi:hypothetical protein